jgi:hypothetical protein
MALTKVSTGVVDMSGNTGGLVIAQGITAQQTTCNAAKLGAIRENTTTNTIEVCTNNSGTPAWKTLKEVAPAAPLTVDFLVIAGGGGGGPGFQAAGGGAGGFRTSFGTGNINGGLTAVESTLTLAVATSYTVTIGVPGAGGAGSAMSAGRGATGSASFFSDGNTTFEILTIGGGGGASYNNYNAGGLSNNGSPGGSGGGAAPHNTGTTANGGTRVTTPVQGFNGGNAISYADPYFGAGGGGAGGIGQVAGGANTGNGGLGLQSSITGLNTFYAAGGAGGAYYSYLGAPNAAASGIGGSGAAASGARGGVGFTAPGNGTVNTGSGGGGGADNGQVGGDGGKGVVILRYPDAYQITFTNGASPIVSSNAVVGTDIVTTITSGTGGTIIFSLKP